MAEISAFDLETQLRDQLGDRLAKDANIYLADSKYYLTPLADMVRLIKSERLDKVVYREEVMDCDDFAVLMYAAAKRSSFKNQKRRLPHTVGLVWGIADGEGAHALNIMMNNDGAIRIVEPQAEPDESVMTVKDSGITGIWMIMI